MPWPNCDVCGGPATGVASSTLGAISFAYCRDCVIEGAEVPGMLVLTIATNGGRHNLSQRILDMIEPTLRRAKLTEEEFNKMVEDGIKSLAEEYANESTPESRFEPEELFGGPEDSSPT